MKKFTILTLAALFIISPFLKAQLVKTVVSVGGEVSDFIDRKPLSVNVELFDSDGKRLQKVKSNSKDGAFFMTSLNPGSTYEIRVAEFDFMKQAFPLPLPNTSKYLEYSKDIQLIPKKVGTKILIPVKVFEINKSKLKVGSDLFLKDYVDLLKLNPTVSIKLTSFPDLNGDATKNMELTKARAQSLKEFFINNGIGAERLSVEGSGTTDPAYPPPTGKASKGKRYVGTSYLVIEGV